MAGLGRGLGSLIPQKNSKKDFNDFDSEKQDFSDDNFERIIKVSPDKIKTNRMQPRSDFDEVALRELADSIKDHGILQPLIAMKLNDGYYELIAGERRLRASRMLGLDSVPIVLRNTDEQERLALALIENIQREDLNCMELARAYRKLLNEFNIKQEELAKIVGKSRPAVTNILRLLKLSKEAQDLLAEGKIEKSVGIALAGVEDENKRDVLLKKILNEKLSFKEAASAILEMGGTKKAKIKAVYEDRERETSLMRFLNTKVKIIRKVSGGQIIIDFYSDEDLLGIINKIK